MDEKKIPLYFKDFFTDALNDNTEQWADVEAITNDGRMIYTAKFIYIITPGIAQVQSVLRNWIDENAANDKG